MGSVPCHHEVDSDSSRGVRQHRAVRSLLSVPEADRTLSGGKALWRRWLERKAGIWATAELLQPCADLRLTARRPIAGPIGATEWFHAGIRRFCAVVRPAVCSYHYEHALPVQSAGAVAACLPRGADTGLDVAHSADSSKGNRHRFSKGFWCQQIEGLCSK